jgi:serine/threonine-protein kinase
VSASKPVVPEPEEIAGRFQIVQKLGAGAFGTVYKARDKVLGRMLAIKTIRMEGLAASQTSHTEMLDRFFREAKVASNLKHPNIVTIYDFGESQGLSYIAMEFIDGVGLDRVVAETGRMPVERAAALGAQVADALGYAHKHDVVHRDIKPANIMIEAGDHVKVTDFGIAKPGDSAEHLTMTGSLLGTPSYMSPEQARGQKLDGRSDLFSMGCVLYEMVAGVKAFRGESITALLFKIITEEPQPIRELDPSVPDEFLRIVAKALSKAPETRYQTGRELSDDLLALTRPGFVPTLRQADVPTVPGGAIPANIPTVASPPTVASAPTARATISSTPTLGRPAGPSATVPAATAPVGPTQLIAPPAPLTAPPAGVTPPPPPPPPRPSARTAVPRPQPTAAPAARRTGGGAGLLLGLGLAGLAVLAVAAVGGWYLLSRRAPAAVSSPPPETVTPAAATPAPAEATTAGGPAVGVGAAAGAPPPLVSPPRQEASAGVRSRRLAQGAGASASAARAAVPPSTAGQTQSAAGGVPAAGGYSFLDELPSEVADGRELGEIAAQKYRSGGSNGLGTTRYRPRGPVPRDLAPFERPAAATLFHLLAAERAYHRTNGRYGGLHDLHAAGLVRLDVPIGADGFRRARYHFTMKVEADGFRAEARPLSPEGRPFYVDESGYILPATE